MKYVSAPLIILLFVTFTACEKKSLDANNAGKMDTIKRTEDRAQKVLDANKLKPIVVLKNPNRMDIETTAIDIATINKEKRIAESLAEKLIEYCVKNTIEMAKEEINKSTNGYFKDFLPGNKNFYLSFLQKQDGVWTIIAHGTSRDFIGIQVIPDQWVDITGWKYLLETVKKEESGETNHLWTENVYWRDSAWANEKTARFSAYNRFFYIDNESYWLHYTIWLDK